MNLINKYIIYKLIINNNEINKYEFDKEEFKIYKWIINNNEINKYEIKNEGLNNINE